ncbi:FAD-dependent oxidoreductase [Jiangella alkaliphila]|uniref:ferredoxin--NADP(+) reductase n=1 Tax=Jiangella alkaliphila TaxID=419479 RepID=A0A1H2GLY8_9ACTN|nr:FAD-dependent oxidoreductase [Jiangella alkaliphila]SDU20673.1 ferredoxin--NADP+ reductase [Jiangella alkaliphila]
MEDDGSRSEAAGRAAAIVGAGPAGLYALAALVKSDRFDRIDVFEAAPAPYGLVRYGVAPDHPKTRNISRVLARGFEHTRVRFLGNVSVGRDVTVDELRLGYDVVAVSTGMLGDRKLGIPGEDLPGSFGASELVAWYTGHPEAGAVELPANLTSATVIGAGNVALDVARILAKDAATLRTTSMPRPVVEALAASTVTDIHLVARRGPAQAKFTSPELHELGALDAVDLVVDPADLELGPADQEAVAQDRHAKVTVDVCREWSQRAATGAPRRIHLHYWRRPVRILGETAVTGIELEPTRPGAAPPLTLPTQLVVRAIGYHGRPIPGLPFDEGSGTVPSRDGRVLDDGEVVAGVYVTGWLRRGPTGVIATNRGDANEVAESVLADLDTLPERPSDPESVDKLLAERDVRVVTWVDWLRLEAHEKAAGDAAGGDPIVVHELATALEVIGAGG